MLLLSGLFEVETLNRSILATGEGELIMPDIMNLTAGEEKRLDDDEVSMAKCLLVSLLFCCVACSILCARRRTLDPPVERVRCFIKRSTCLY